MGENRPFHDQRDHMEEPCGPFRDEADVMIDHAAQHDDISKTQSRSNAAVEVSAEHVSELLYEPGYMWDPRSSSQGMAYYPEDPHASEGKPQQHLHSEQIPS